MSTIKGKVVYHDFEGGFWGIEGDDGKKYNPTELPTEFRKDGCRVEVEYERAQIMSIQMWGIAIDVKSIHALND